MYFNFRFLPKNNHNSFFSLVGRTGWFANWYTVLSIDFCTNTFRAFISKHNGLIKDIWETKFSSQVSILNTNPFSSLGQLGIIGRSSLDLRQRFADVQIKYCWTEWLMMNCLLWMELPLTSDQTMQCIINQSKLLLNQFAYLWPNLMTI